MKRLVLLFLTSILTLSIHAEDPNSPDTRCVFKSFVYIATVGEDNTWTVTEKIVADFKEPRHGIYKYIETRYSDLLDGELYNYSIEVSNIKVANYSYETQQEKGGEFEVIKIGDDSHTVSGEVEYTIDYKLHFNDDRYAKSDILYTTILGAQWRNEIEDFQFGIRFNKPLPADFAKNFKILSGKLGETKNALNVNYQIDLDKNSIYGRVLNVSHHNAITLHATLPEGFWHVRNTEIAQLNDLSRSLLFAAVAIFVVALVYLLQNRRRLPAAVIEYSAPDDIDSAAVGCIMDDVADVSDMTSLIIWWASKGFLKIEEKVVEGTGRSGKKKTEIVLHMLQDLPHDIQGYQRAFWKTLFKGGRTECNVNKDLRDRGASVKHAIMELNMHFKGSRKLVTFNKKAFILVALYALCGSLSILFSSRVAAFDRNYLVAVLTWIPLIIGYGFWSYKNADKSLKEYLRENKSQRTMILLSMVLMCFYTIKVVYNLYNPHDNVLPQYAMEGIVAGGWVLVMLVKNMRKDSAYRMQKLPRILGFREFIKTAELPMLKAMVDENPDYFYEVLPFAMVFGLTDKWYEHFANITVSDPDWYVADGGSLSHNTSLNAGLAASTLNSSLGNLISTGLLVSSISLAIDVATSSGGGHSGGGGGGGGGGSW